MPRHPRHKSVLLSCMMTASLVGGLLLSNMATSVDWWHWYEWLALGVFALVPVVVFYFNIHYGLRPKLSIGDLLPDMEGVPDDVQDALGEALENLVSTNLEIRRFDTRESEVRTPAERARRRYEERAAQRRAKLASYRDAPRPGAGGHS